MLKRLWNVAVLLSCLGVIAGCGFNLRGSDSSQALSDAYVVELLPTDVEPMFVRALNKRWLQHVGTEVVANQRIFYLHLLHYAYERKSVTIDPFGRTNEYELIMTVDFQWLTDSQQEEAYTYRLRSQRFMRFDREQLTVKNREENALINEMWSELILRIRDELGRQG